MMNGGPGCEGWTTGRRQPFERRSAAARLMLLLALLAQLALVLHQLEHRQDPDAATPSADCTICHFAAGMTPPPEPMAVRPPTFGILAQTIPLDEAW